MAGLFSVIIPVYNRAHCVTEALDSVKAQTWRPIEVIVVEDGSTDDSLAVVQKWAANNQEPETLVVKIIAQANAGACVARNRGLEAASGDWIQFLDSDDLLQPHRLKTLAAIFENEEADFIHTGFEGFDPETGKVTETRYGRLKNTLIEQAAMGVHWPITAREAFTADLLRSCEPWRGDMVCFQDREYVDRVLLVAKKPIVVREVSVSVRRGGGERISDRHKTREGRQCRIRCERSLVEGLRGRDDLALPYRQELRERIYALGLRCAIAGWPDLAGECLAIGDRVEGCASPKGRALRLLLASGKPGSCLYSLWKGRRTKAA